MQPATPEQLQSIIHETPCAGEAFRIALQTNTGLRQAINFGDAKKMASECKIKKRLKQYVKKT
jgi:hypothetical protein